MSKSCNIVIMAESNPFDSDLISNSVNYHGHELLKLLASMNGDKLKSKKLQDIDYKLYKNRTSIIEKNRSRAQEIINFIASKSDKFLTADHSNIKIPTINPNYEDVYENQFPLDYFLQTDTNIRMNQLLKTIQRGDILYTMVYSRDDKNYKLKIIAFDNGKHLYFGDFQSVSNPLKIIMNAADTIAERKEGEVSETWIIGTRLRVEVLSIETDAKTIYVGTNGLTADFSKNGITLGKIIIADLPSIFTCNMKFKHLSNCIERLKICKNPKSVEELSEQYEIPLTDYPTLMTNIRTDIPKNLKAPSLRKAQLAKWAHKHVADGVNKFKNGNHTLAFQCIEKALKIDPENEEAFVAKGALLANLSHYEKAIEEFKKALVLNPNHQNANKYMCETLVELGRQHKEDSKFSEAGMCFKQCVEIDKDHATARQCLEELIRETDDVEILKLLEPIVKPVEEKKDIFQEIEAIQEEYKMKTQEVEKPPIVEEEQKKPLDPPLSPLSQKMAMNVQMWEQSSNPAPNFNCPPPQCYYPQQNYYNPASNITPNSQYPSIGNQPQVLSAYDQKVAQFLESLQSRVSTDKKDMGHHKDKGKDSSRSRNRRYSTSSSSSSSSSSDNSSKSKKRHKRKKHKHSSSRRRSSRKHKRRNQSKSKEDKYKKRKKSSSSSSSESRSRSISPKRKSSKKDNSNLLTECDDLEKKLQAYYQKMNELNSSSVEQKSKSKEKKHSSQSLKNTSETTKKNSGKKTGLKVHPVFMESSSSSEDEEQLKMGQKSLSASNRALKMMKAGNNGPADKRNQESISPKYGYYSNKPVYHSDKNKKTAQESLKKDNNERPKVQLQFHGIAKSFIRDQSRFGKWASDNTTPDTKKSKVDMFDNSKIDASNKQKKGPDQTLAEYEKFLQKARERRLELMKERNKSFVKPSSK